MPIIRFTEKAQVLILTGLSAIVHFLRLGLPNEIIFDETYYAKWGQDYLQGQAFFDVHPPLGKLLTGVSVWLFQSNPEAGTGAFGWRFIGALLGVFLVPLTYSIAKRLFISRKVGVLAASFVLLDGLLLVQTRTALLDSFLLFFTLAAVASYLAYRDATTKTHAARWLGLTGILIGLGLASKWTAVAGYALILVTALAFPNKRIQLSPWFYGVFLGIAPLIIYGSSFIFDVREVGYWEYLLNWHQQTWHFHQTLRAEHPYMSRWWSWLLLYRPVWYYYNEQNEIVRAILALGNPLIWWAGIGALIASLWQLIRHRTANLIIPLLGFFAFYLPWTVIGRTQFQYYIVGGIPFLAILLAYWVHRLLERTSWRWLAWLYIGLVIASFIFFYPMLTGWPMTSEYYQQHIWLKSWI